MENSSNRGPAARRLDRFDLAILRTLQKDAAISLNELALRVGLTATPCWRRVQHLEKAGIIRSRVALLDRQRLGVGVTVFVAIRTNRHDLSWFQSFHSLVASIPEVTEFYRMAGQTDYLLRVMVPDIAAYDQIYKKLISAGGITDVDSSFAMEEIKYTTELPLGYAPK